MKTCYLHIGFHKTATTTFQQICGGNRDELKKAGIFYPQFDYSPEKKSLQSFRPIIDDIQTWQCQSNKKEIRTNSPQRIKTNQP